ncbi:hypothetical protein DYH09_02880 [bacterium CPR1]|nr:hypothetical protein [bacterium CPR1]
MSLKPVFARFLALLLMLLDGILGFILIWYDGPVRLLGIVFLASALCLWLISFWKESSVTLTLAHYASLVNLTVPVTMWAFGHMSWGWALALGGLSFFVYRYGQEVQVP